MKNITQNSNQNNSISKIKKFFFKNGWEPLHYQIESWQAFLNGAFTVPGDGCIDYKTFLKVLYKKNYKGWLVVEAEQDPAKANPFEYAKIGYNYLSKTARECGFEIIN